MIAPYLDYDTISFSENSTSGSADTIYTATYRCMVFFELTTLDAGDRRVRLSVSGITSTKRVDLMIMPDSIYPDYAGGFTGGYTTLQFPTPTVLSSGQTITADYLNIIGTLHIFRLPE